MPANSGGWIDEEIVEAIFIALPTNDLLLPGPSSRRCRHQTSGLMTDLDGDVGARTIQTIWGRIKTVPGSSWIHLTQRNSGKSSSWNSSRGIGSLNLAASARRSSTLRILPEAVFGNSPKVILRTRL